MSDSAIDSMKELLPSWSARRILGALVAGDDSIHQLFKSQQNPSLNSFIKPAGFNYGKFKATLADIEETRVLDDEVDVVTDKDDEHFPIPDDELFAQDSKSSDLHSDPSANFEEEQEGELALEETNVELTSEKEMKEESIEDIVSEVISSTVDLIVGEQDSSNGDKSIDTVLASPAESPTSTVDTLFHIPVASSADAVEQLEYPAPEDISAQIDLNNEPDIHSPVESPTDTDGIDSPVTTTSIADDEYDEYPDDSFSETKLKEEEKDEEEDEEEEEAKEETKRKPKRVTMNVGDSVEIRAAVVFNTGSNQKQSSWAREQLLVPRKSRDRKTMIHSESNRQLRMRKQEKEYEEKKVAAAAQALLRRKLEYGSQRWKADASAASRPKTAASSKSTKPDPVPEAIKPPVPKTQQEIFSNNSPEFLAWKAQKEIQRHEARKQEQEEHAKLIVAEKAALEKRTQRTKYLHDKIAKQRIELNLGRARSLSPTKRSPKRVKKPENDDHSTAKQEGTSSPTSKQKKKSKSKPEILKATTNFGPYLMPISQKPKRTTAPPESRLKDVPRDHPLHRVVFKFGKWMGRTRSRILDVFRKMDEAGTGIVSREVFETVLPRVGINLTVEECTSVFAMFDADNTGDIDYCELVKLLRQCHASAAATKARREEKAAVARKQRQSGSQGRRLTTSGLATSRKNKMHGDSQRNIDASKKKNVKLFGSNATMTKKKKSKRAEKEERCFNVIRSAIQEKLKEKPDVTGTEMLEYLRVVTVPDKFSAVPLQELANSAVQLLSTVNAPSLNTIPLESDSLFRTFQKAIYKCTHDKKEEESKDQGNTSRGENETGDESDGSVSDVTSAPRLPTVANVSQKESTSNDGLVVSTATTDEDAEDDKNEVPETESTCGADESTNKKKIINKPKPDHKPKARRRARPAPICKRGIKSPTQAAAVLLYSETAAVFEGGTAGFSEQKLKAIRIRVSAATSGLFILSETNVRALADAGEMSMEHMRVLGCVCALLGLKPTWKTLVVELKEWRKMLRKLDNFNARTTNVDEKMTITIRETLVQCKRRKPTNKVIKCFAEWLRAQMQLMEVSRTHQSRAKQKGKTLAPVDIEVVA